ASKKEGVEALLNAIDKILQQQNINDKKTWLLAEKAYYLIQHKKMKQVTKQQLKNDISAEGENFNLYSFIKKY
ncbi:MAG: methylmalonyl Co-A mutase-associated GTPase MeaB, partial [Ferruginibacter sp.]